MKYTIKQIGFLLLAGVLGNSAFAQVIVTDSTSIRESPQVATVEQATNNGRFRVDGVAAVVGDYVVLKSDIDRMYIELQSQGASMKDVTACNLAGQVMENKLYAHQAVQDSIVVSDTQVNGQLDQQFGYMVQELGSMEKVVEFYGKSNEAELRADVFQLIKENMMAQQMQQMVVEAVEVTPEEVRTFFSNISEEERPRFGAEVELAQIVVKPEVPESEKQKIIDRLKEMRTDIVENGASFNTKAVLYSQDPGSKSSGGKISLARNDPYAKEFKDAAFSLQEGEVSQPFETMYGFHILTVDRIRGQQVDVRHILLIPDVTEETKQAAREEIDNVRQKLMDGELAFSEAAMAVSDDVETRLSGGQLINPLSGDTRFELTKSPPELYVQVSDLDEGEISNVLTDQDDTGRPIYKIMTVTKKIPEHEADYAQDYNKIKNLALRDKQMKVLEKWMEEKIQDTYVKVNGEYRDCEFSSNWLKK